MIANRRVRLDIEISRDDHVCWLDAVVCCEPVHELRDELDLLQLLQAVCCAVREGEVSVHY